MSCITWQPLSQQQFCRVHDPDYITTTHCQQFCRVHDPAYSTTTHCQQLSSILCKMFLEDSIKNQIFFFFIWANVLWISKYFTKFFVTVKEGFAWYIAFRFTQIMACSIGSGILAWQQGLECTPGSTGSGSTGSGSRVWQQGRTVGPIVCTIYE